MISLFFIGFLTLIGMILLIYFPLELSLMEFIGIGVILGSFLYTWSVFLLSLFLPFSLAIFLAILGWFLFLVLLFFKDKNLKNDILPVPSGSCRLAGRKEDVFLVSIPACPAGRPTCASRHPPAKAGGILEGWNKLKEKIFKTKLSREEAIFLIIESVFALIFLWLFPKIILAPSDQGWHVGLNSFGDTQFHVAVISSFAYGENIPPQHPLFAGIFFSYPFMADFFSGILIRIGESLRLAVLIPTVVFSLIIVHLIFFLTKRLTKSVAAAIFALTLFLFNGGLGFWYFLQDNKGQSLISALLFLNKDYTHIFEENMHFTNIISGFLEEERSLLFGIPIFIIILFFLFLERKRQSVTSIVIFAGILYGLLPLTHSHAFFIVTAVVGWYAMVDIIYSRGRQFKKWLWFFLPGILIAIPQLFLIFPQVASASGSFIRQYWGWMKKPEESFLIYWFKTAGPIFILVPLALVSSRVSDFLKFLFIPFLIIFFAANIWLFQPYNWDNVKFFIFVLLASSILGGKLLSLWWQLGKISKAFVILIIFLSSISGFLSIWVEPRPHNLLYSNKDIETAEFIKKNTETRAIFLTGPQHNSPALLAGRKILVGYPGYLWVHGINWSQREKDSKRMYQANSSDDFFLLAREYKITHVLIGPMEWQEMRPNINFFEKNLVKIFDNGLYRIFKL